MNCAFPLRMRYYEIIIERNIKKNSTLFIVQLFAGAAISYGLFETSSGFRVG